MHVVYNIFHFFFFFFYLLLLLELFLLLLGELCDSHQTNRLPFLITQSYQLLLCNSNTHTHAPFLY